MRLLIAVWCCAVLAGCASNPGLEAPGDFAAPSERGMFVALAEVGASDQQRLAVMDAWDDMHGKLADLDDEAQRALQDFRELDRRDAGFAKQSAALAKRYGDIARERMTLSAKFEGRVAAVLTEKQWDRWQQDQQRPESGFGDSAPRRRGPRRP